MSRAKDSKILNFNIDTPLDIEYAIKSMKGNKTLFYSLLVKFISGIFKAKSPLDNITVAFEDQNWKKYKEAAHQLKGQCAYIGAGHLHYDCFFIQDAFNKDCIRDMAMRYNRLIENAIQVVEYATDMILQNPEAAQYVKKNQVVQIDFQNDVKLPTGFELRKSGRSDAPYFCLNVGKGQTIEKRLNDRLGEEIKPENVEFMPLNSTILGGTYSQFRKSSAAK